MSSRTEETAESPTTVIRQALHEYEAELAELQSERAALDERITELEEKIDTRRAELEAQGEDSTTWFDFTRGVKLQKVCDSFDLLAEDAPGSGVTPDQVVSHLSETYGAPREEVEEIITSLVEQGRIYESGNDAYKVLS
ncbi:hypothetical protein [Salinibaculum rarum]|uniref:hypothetical protein n=1 Tax=Salinibaculum rarum TaxID=3058903 RepID=UPI00265FFFDC|nr:hypothetical protein [Salinibaculum sp. KK48]